MPQIVKVFCDTLKCWLLALTPINAILAKCADCCCYYDDGREDCGNVTCSLYHWMPYRHQKPNYTWRQYHPKRSGLHRIPPKRKASPQAIAALAKARQKLTK